MKATLAAIPLALLAAVPEPPAPHWPDLEPRRTWGLTVADWNGDGVGDVLVNNHRDGFPNLPDWRDLLLVSDGNTWRVELELPYADRHGCSALDANADGLLDFFCAVGAQAGGGTGPSELWLQHGGGWVESAVAWGIDDPYARGRFAATVDWDGDGRDDLFVSVEPRARVDPIKAPAAIWLNRGDHFVKVPVNGRYGTHCAVAWRGGVVVCDEGRLADHPGAWWLVPGRPPVELGPYPYAATMGDALVLVAADHVLIGDEYIDLPRPARTIHPAQGGRPARVSPQTAVSAGSDGVYIIAEGCREGAPVSDMIIVRDGAGWVVADAPNSAGCTSTVAHLGDQVLVISNGVGGLLTSDT